MLPHPPSRKKLKMIQGQLCSIWTFTFGFNLILMMSSLDTKADTPQRGGVKRSYLTPGPITEEQLTAVHFKKRISIPSFSCDFEPVSGRCFHRMWVEHPGYGPLGFGMDAGHSVSDLGFAFKWHFTQVLHPNSHSLAR